MFVPPEPVPASSAPTTLTPGPTFERVFDPRHHHSELATIAAARKAAHFQRRPYFLWDDALYVAVSAEQHLATTLTRADILPVKATADDQA